MRFRRLFFVLCASAFIGSGASQADILQTEVLKGKADGFKASGSQQVLINGRPAEDGEFPGLVRIFSGSGSCSAQVTGKNSLSTAAHCIPADKKVNFQLNGEQFVANCITGDQRALDVAVCRLDKEISGIKYITVAGPQFAAYAAKKNQTVVKSGYGCITIDGTGGNDGILRIGSSTVVQEFWKDGKTKREQYFETQGVSTVCYGDSGGAVLAAMKDTKSERHVLVGINSRVYTNAQGRIVNRDILVDVAGPSAQQFYQNVIATNPGLEICGVNVQCDTGALPEAPGGSGSGGANQCKDALKNAVEKCGG